MLQLMPLNIKLLEKNLKYKVFPQVGRILNCRILHFRYWYVIKIFVGVIVENFENIGKALQLPFILKFELNLYNFLILNNISVQYEC